MRKLLYIAALIICSISKYNAQCITTPAFNGNEIIESFEGLTPDANLIMVGDYLIPGVVSAYTFSSGVSFTSPIPNQGLGNEHLIGDFNLGSPGFGLGGNGGINLAADIPFGSAYFAYDNIEGGAGPAEFTFPAPMETVGFYFTGSNDGNNSITVNAYDCNNTLITSCTGPYVNITNWGSNFIGVTSTTGICRIEISGTYFVIDNLTFEEPAVVMVDTIPTMGEWGLIALTILFLICAVTKIKQTESEESIGVA